MYGVCVECGFPILIKDNNPISCPMCTTKNKPISATLSSTTAAAIASLIIIGGILIKKVGKNE